MSHVKTREDGEKYRKVPKTALFEWECPFLKNLGLWNLDFKFFIIKDNFLSGLLFEVSRIYEIMTK